MANIVEDASTPNPSQVTASAGVAYSSTFSPPANSLVIVLISWQQFANSTGQFLVVADTAGTPNSYPVKASLQDSDGSTINAIAEFYYTTAPGPIQIKVTNSNTGSANALIAPRVVNNANSVQTSAATASASANATNIFVGSITTTQSGSWVYTVAGCGLPATLVPTNSGTTAISNWNNSQSNDSSAVGRMTYQTGSPAATSLGWTASTNRDFGWVAVEVLAATAATASANLTGGMTIPVLTPMNAGSIVSANDFNNIGNACTFLMNKPIARVHDTAGTLAIGTSATDIIYGASDFDTDNMWNSSFNTRLTVQTPGFYKIFYMVDAGVVSGNTIVLNSQGFITTGPNNPAGPGVTNVCWPGYSAPGSPSGRGTARSSGVIPWYMYAGDYVRVQAFSASTGLTTNITGFAASYLALEFVSV